MPAASRYCRSISSSSSTWAAVFPLRGRRERLSDGAAASRAAGRLVLVGWTISTELSSDKSDSSLSLVGRVLLRADVLLPAALLAAAWLAFPRAERVVRPVVVAAGAGAIVLGRGE